MLDESESCFLCVLVSMRHAWNNSGQGSCWAGLGSACLGYVNRLTEMDLALCRIRHVQDIENEIREKTLADGLCPIWIPALVLSGELFELFDHLGR